VSEIEQLRARVAELQEQLAGLRWSDEEQPNLLDQECPVCRPLGCDDPDRHMGVPSRYTPLANRGCRCGADFDGRDCMCFEGLE
jgi:hypothetical protein